MMKFQYACITVTQNCFLLGQITVSFRPALSVFADNASAEAQAEKSFPSQDNVQFNIFHSVEIQMHASDLSAVNSSTSIGSRWQPLYLLSI